MGRKWTDETARAYVAKVQAGRNQVGLTYCSALDYIMNHTGSKKEKPKISVEDIRDDNSETPR